MADDRRYEGNNWKRVAGGGGGEFSHKTTYYNYSCPVSLKLNQVLLVTSQPVNIAAWLIVLIVTILVLYSTALNLYFAFIITVFERIFIQGASSPGMSGQQRTERTILL